MPRLPCAKDCCRSERCRRPDAHQTADDLHALLAAFVLHFGAAAPDVARAMADELRRDSAKDRASDWDCLESAARASIAFV